MTTGEAIAIDPARIEADRLLAAAPQHALTPTVVWEVARILLVISAGVLAHAWNLFNYPRYQGDEGVYMSAAWAVTHGQIYPYTYSYGHPPLGWTLIAAWCQLTGGFFSFGTAINTGRVFMLGIYALSALFVYLIARRLSRTAWTALLATTIFSFSPLSVYYQREILLDNIATFWILLAFYLQISSESRLRYIAGSGLAFGVGVLSKETMIVLLPALVYGTWLQASQFQRRYLLIVFAYLALASVSTFMLLATLKNEFFPTGTLFGGANPHVSMIATYLQQAGRGSSEGSFLEQWSFWQHSDGLLMVVGVLSIAGNLLLGRRRPVLWVAALMALLYLLLLARGGVTFAYYVIPLIPLLALNIALLVHTIAQFVVSAGARIACPMDRVAIAPVAFLSLLIVLLLHDLELNNKNLTADETGPQVAAIQWIGAHVPRSAMIIVNHYEWLDLRSEGGLGAGYGAPFDHAEMYWVVATDPAIGTGVFHDDWNNVDYIVADSDMFIDANSFHMKLLLAALKHAVPIKTFQNPLYWVRIYQVQHSGSTDTSGPTLSQEVGRLPTTVATPMPLAPAGTATPGATSTPAATVILTPIADTYVRDGTYAGTNFGAERDLYVKQANTGFDRYAYLKFDLSGIRGTITSATLRLYGRNLGLGSYSGTDLVYAVTDNSWNESGSGGITWNTRPALHGAPLTSTTIGLTSRYYEWNVSSFVAQQQHAGQQVSLGVAMSTWPPTNAPDLFNGREAAANRPELVVTTGGAGTDMGIVPHSAAPPQAATATAVPAGATAVPPTATTVPPTAAVPATATLKSPAIAAHTTRGATSPSTAVTVILAPIADTYVRDGSYAAANFGAEHDLYVKQATTGYDRYAYLKFDLSGIRGTITSATLRLYGRNPGSGSYSGADLVYAVTDNSWNESGSGGITWNTRPALSGAPLAAATIGPTSQYYGWNVSSFVAQQQHAGQQVSLGITMLRRPATNLPDLFNGREAAANRPELVVTTR